MTADGHTYERAAIEKWLKTKNTSPSTRATLETKKLVPNHCVKQAIAAWHSRGDVVNPVVVQPSNITSVTLSRWKCWKRQLQHYKDFIQPQLEEMYAMAAWVIGTDPECPPQRTNECPSPQGMFWRDIPRPFKINADEFRGDLQGRLNSHGTTSALKEPQRHTLLLCMIFRQSGKMQRNRFKTRSTSKSKKH